jgi:hypothetical protein
MSSILRRLPPVSAILPVYAVVAFPIFSWTTVSWFWKLPYWLNFLNGGEIAAIFAYSMATALFESLIVIGFLLLLCLILPSNAFRDLFVIRGSWLALGLTLSFLGHAAWRGFLGFSYIESSLLPWTLISVVVMLLITFAAARVRFMTRTAAWLSDRLTVFLYLIVPIAILSLIVVVVRNIV